MAIDIVDRAHSHLRRRDQPATEHLPAAPPLTDHNNLTDFALVTIKGMAVALGRRRDAETEELAYSILEPATSSEVDAEPSWTEWRTLSLAQGASTEVRVGGMSLLTLPLTAVRLEPANAPFQVIVDGTDIFCFSPSKRGTLYLNHLRLVEIPRQAATAKSVTAQRSAPRFDIHLAWEARFVASADRDVPADELDRRGVASSAGTPFIEPTIELVDVTAANRGFAVAMVPSDTAVTNWYVITPDDKNNLRVLRYTRDLDSSIRSVVVADSFVIMPHLSTGATSFEKMPLTGQVAAACYFQQERLFDGGDSSAASTMRRAGHLMICACVELPSAGGAKALVAYDFAIDANGRIPKITGDPSAGGTAARLVDGSIKDKKFIPDVSKKSFPIPIEALQVVEGLPVSAVVLGAVRLWGNSAPLIFASADGLIHLYYCGERVDDTAPSKEAGEFLVAQFNTRVSRVVLKEYWIQQGEGKPLDDHHVDFTAVTPGQALMGTTVTIKDFPRPGFEDLCNVSIDYSPKSGLSRETWEGVPRDLEHFLNVLNGSTTPDTSSPDAQAGLATYFNGSGKQMMARIPLDPVPTDARFRRCVTFVGTRMDTPLRKVSVTTQNERSTVLLEFTGADNAILSQRWRDLPAKVSELLPILNGTAHPEAYQKPLEDDETRIYGLRVSAPAGQPSILLYRQKTDAVEIKITSIESQPNRCRLQIGTAVSLEVPRSPSEFAKAVQSNEKFKAEFVHVSVADETSTPLQDQTVTAPLSRQGMTAAFDVLLPDDAVAGKLASMTQEASVVQKRTPETTSPSMIGLMALTRKRPADADRAVMINSSHLGGADAPLTVEDGAWLREEKRYASRLSGARGWEVDMTRPSAVRLRLGLAMTFEAWINPHQARESNLLTYFDREEKSPGIRQTQKVVIKTLTATSLQLPVSVAEVRSGVLLEEPVGDAAQDLTVELWLRLLREPGAGELTLLDARTRTATAPSFALVLIDGRLAARWTEETERRLVCAAEPLPVDRWVHVVLSGRELLTGNGELQLFIDGQPVARGAATLDACAEIWRLGPDPGKSTLEWRICGLHVWNAHHPAAWLRDVPPASRATPDPSLRLAMNTPASGNEEAHENRRCMPLLAGGSLVPAEAWVPDAKTQDLALQIGSGAATRYANALSVGEWNHVAVASRSGGAVRLNPPGSYEKGIYHSVNCGNPPAFNFTSQGAIGARVLIGPATHNQVIFSKGKIDGVHSSLAYALWIDVSGRPELTLHSDHGAVRVRSDIPIADGEPHVIYAALRAINEVDRNDGKLGFHAVAELWVEAKGKLHYFTQDRWEKDPSKMTGGIIINNAPLMLGSLGSTTELPPTNRWLLNGTITDVRVWNSLPAALKHSKRSYPIGRITDSDLARDLVAEWLFEEPGTIARDTVGTYDAVISHTGLHVALRGSLDVYVNGQRRQAAGAAVADDNLKEGQFVIGGALQGSAGTPVRGFDGRVAEVRYWPAIRPPAEIRTTRHRAITGSDPGLGAAWNFYSASDNAEDVTGYDNKAHLQGAQFTELDAPVSNEPPAVRNVYGTRKLPPSRLVHRPAVCTFVHTLSGAGAVPQSILRQCHILKEAGNDARLSRSADFNLGTLDYVYIGQAYSEPMLIGYVEGAPPIPSENLSQPYYLNAGTVAYRAYLGATQITLTEEKEATRDFAASQSFDTKGESNLKAGGMFEVKGSIMIPPYIDRSFAVEGEAVGKLKFGWSAKNDSSAALSTVDRKTLKVSVALTGQWEEPLPGRKTFLNTDVGRRFIPNNAGAAVLQAMAADLYSLVLTATDTMVQVVAVTDPSVTPDTSVVMFPINPGYVKNGTLDGKIGYVNDPDYPDADAAWGSYCKPHETRRIEKELERRTAELAARHIQYNQWSGIVGQDKASLLEHWYKEAAGRIGIVNTYNWTSSGGGSSESAAMTLKYERKFTRGTGVNFGIGLEGKLKASAKAGFTGALDFMQQFEWKADVSGVDSQRIVRTMDVLVNCEAFLQTWKPDEATFTSGPGPGKVTGYRFKSFFLPPSTDNSNDFARNVIDQNWLQCSNSPEAATLRSALLRSEGQPSWRVLHRVTYVSRVPPAGATPKATLATTRKTPPVNQDENAALTELIKRSAGLKPYTPERIAGAVTAVLGTGGSSEAKLDTMIPWWQNLRTTQGDEFYRIKRRVLQYMLRLLIDDDAD